ncbi:MAG: DNA polymerase III subunit gamma/tau [Candidatus Limnocylindrales bacterium]
MSDQPSSEPIPTTSHQAIYRRFRAQTFGQMVGQRAVVETLRNAVRLGRLGHGLLFVGPRGTGKTSTARILAKAVNCTDLRDGEPCDACTNCVSIREGRALDVIELDAASNNRVDDMRELVPRVYTTAADLRRKVFIIDEVQRIKEGWDVLLKTLEEPPEGVLFVFCTTDPSQIRPAVVSRLQRFTFRPLSQDEIRGKLRRILEAEGRTASPDAIDLIARLAGGGMRDAESLLDQVLATSDEVVDAGLVEDLLGLAQEASVDGFIDALASGDALAGIAVLDALEGEGRDLVSFSDQVVSRLRERLVTALGQEGPADVARLSAAARRLTGIDASRSGLGGYRWQLELALLGAAASPAPAATTSPSPAPPPVAERPTTAARPSNAPERPARSAAAPEPVVAPTPVVAAPEPVVAPTPVAGPLAAPTHEPGAAPAKAAAPEPVSATVPVASADPAPAPAAAGSDLLDDLRSRWPEIVAWIGRNPANKPLVENCRPVEVRDGFVILGFPEDQPFLREKAEQRRTYLEDGLAHVLGRPVAVRCVVANIELADGQGATDDGIDLVAQARRVFGGDIADIDEIG